jgi:hypothetical protein
VEKDIPSIKDESSEESKNEKYDSDSSSLKEDEDE